MRCSPASRDHSNIPAHGALTFRGAARSLVQSRELTSAGRPSALAGCIQMCGGSGRAVQTHTEDEAGSPCDCQLALC